MPTDFAFYYLTQPLGILFQLALFVVPVLLLRAAAPMSFRKIGFRRIAQGYGGVALVTLCLALFEAFTLGRSKVALGHIPAETFAAWVSNSVLYLFVLMFIFTLLFTSLLIAPLAIWFRSHNRATIPAIVMVGVVVAFLIAALSVAFPSNEWARAHPFEEFLKILSSIGIGIILVPFGFGLGARLPFRPGDGENAS